MRHPMADNADTPQRILDIAERLVQTRGFNGFSYADIAGPLRITKASPRPSFPNHVYRPTTIALRHAAKPTRQLLRSVQGLL